MRNCSVIFIHRVSDKKLLLKTAVMPWLRWWAWACEPKGCQFDSQSWHMAGLRAKSPVGDGQETTTHWCFSESTCLLPLGILTLASITVFHKFISCAGYIWRLCDVHSTVIAMPQNLQNIAWYLLIILFLAQHFVFFRFFFLYMPLAIYASFSVLPKSTVSHIYLFCIWASNFRKHWLNITFFEKQ